MDFIYKNWYYYIEEVKVILTYFFISCFITIISLYTTKLQLFYKLVGLEKIQVQHFIVTNIYEFFFTIIFIIILISFLLNLSFYTLLGLLWFHSFLTRGKFKLYLLYNLFTLINFIGTFLLINYLILPLTLNFFFNLTEHNYYFNLNYELKIDSFITNIVYWFFLIFVCFQIPISILCFLNWKAILPLIGKRKTYYIMFLFLFSIIFNGDLILQIICSVFLFLLLELFFFLVLFLSKLKKN